jgi:hypothetical protein
MPATPTQIGVIDFDTNVISSLNPTTVKASVLSAINSIGHTGATEYTNWEAALKAADNMVGAGGLVVIITDGNPTTSNGPLSDIDDAITAANAIKNSGTRILAIGINSSGTQGGLNLANLQKISGNQVIPPGTLTDINLVDVFMGNISELGVVLTDLTTALCGGTITVTKLVDQAPASGWTFDIGGTSKVTNQNGQTEAVHLNASTYSVSETVVPGYSFVSAACTGATNNGSQGQNSVTGIVIGNTNIVSCVFYNSTLCVPSTEVCDGVDNDCDGQIDEDLTRPTTCGVGACSQNAGLETCTAGNWGGDTCNPYQGAGTEICNGSGDEDCDGSVDEGCQCTNGTIQQCGSTDVGECAYGTQTCADGAWGTCVGSIDPIDEICNDDLDNDCDGQIDEDCPYCGDQICNGGESCSTCSQDCGECPPATGTISGHKYNDLDQDGTYDGNEPGLGGWNIWIDLNDNGVFDGNDWQTTSDGTNGGLYAFPPVAVGTYNVCEIMENHTGWATVNPICQSVTVVENQTITADFFNYQVCDPNIELITNGGFETPMVTDPALWDIFNSGLTSWVTGWMYDSPTQSGNYFRPEQASLELQRGTAGSPHSGDQLAELDSDWFGPSNAIGAPSAVKIYQDIETIPGQNYTVSFWFSPRPSTQAENNALGFDWNSGAYTTTVTNGAGENNTTWTQHTYTVIATSSTTRIQFSDLGLPSDSLGTYLDDVSVRCISTECQSGATQVCPIDALGVCAAGTKTCSQNGVWGQCVQNTQSSTETCTGGTDEDCDGLIDCADTTDCGQATNCQSTLSCGDQICNGEETCSTCSQDCGSCGGGGGGGSIAVHIATCGDGVYEVSYEQCDDGNTINGDGCSSVCTIETVAGASTEQPGEVLGESTTLPETGENPFWITAIALLIAFGSALGIKKLSVNPAPKLK